MTDEELFACRLAAEIIYPDVHAWNDGELDGAVHLSKHFSYWIVLKNFLVESTRQFFKVGDRIKLISDVDRDVMFLVMVTEEEKNEENKEPYWP